VTKALTRPKKVDQSPPKMLTSCFSETTGESVRIDQAGPLGHSGLTWSYFKSVLQGDYKFYRHQLIIFRTGCPQIKMPRIIKSEELALRKLFSYLRIVIAELKPSHPWFEISLPNQLLGGKGRSLGLGGLRRLV